MATVMGAAFHNYYTCVAEDAVATSVDGAHERAIWLMKKRYLVRTVEKNLELLAGVTEDQLDAPGSKSIS